MVSFEPAESETYAILGDRHRMGQVLSNLLSNACKFVSEGTGIVHCTVRFERWTSGEITPPTPDPAVAGRGGAKPAVDDASKTSTTDVEMARDISAASTVGRRVSIDITQPADLGPDREPVIDSPRSDAAAWRRYPERTRQQLRQKLKQFGVTDPHWRLLVLEIRFVRRGSLRVCPCVCV
jgi:hypothetical protein